MEKKKILIISMTNQDSDPRVIRQINFLKEEYDIWCCGISNSLVDGERFIPVNVQRNNFVRKLIIGGLKALRFYSAAEKYILKNKYETSSSGQVFDVIIANDMDSLPVAFKKFKAEKIIADFHEYAPLEFEDKLYWKLIHKNYIIFQCKKYFPLIDAATTVCKSIAREYEKNFGKLPVVITNAPEYQVLKPGPVGSKIKIIHHGAAISSRKIEIMIEAAKLLDDRFSFDLMLVCNEKDYYEKLKEMTSTGKNINIINPVSFSEIIPFCNKYDIGLFTLPPVNFNYRYALPNKFFEFVQARLAIVTGPSVEMADLTNEYKLGVVTKSFEPAEIADKINMLTYEQIFQFKINADNAAKELSDGKNKKLFNEIINKTLTD